MNLLRDGIWWVKCALWKKWDDIVDRYLRWCDAAPEREP